MLEFTVSPMAQAYRYLEQLECRGAIDTVRARFLKIVFYRLKERLGLQYMRSNNVVDMAKIISNSGLVSCDIDIIKSKITRWTDLGRRIDLFCRSIGASYTNEESHLGNIFCLPEHCNDELSVKGSNPLSPNH